MASSSNIENKERVEKMKNLFRDKPFKVRTRCSTHQWGTIVANYEIHQKKEQILEILTRAKFDGILHINERDIPINFQHWVCNYFDWTTSTMELPNGHVLEYKKEDLHRIYGVPCGGLRITNEVKDSVRRKNCRRFCESLGFHNHSTGNLKLKELKTAMLNCEDPEVYVKMLILAFIACIVEHKTGDRVLTSDYMEALKEVDDISKFDWCDKFFANFIEGLRIRKSFAAVDMLSILCHVFDKTCEGQYPKLEPSCRIWTQSRGDEMLTQKIKFPSMLDLQKVLKEERGLSIVVEGDEGKMKKMVRGEEVDQESLFKLIAMKNYWVNYVGEHNKQLAYGSKQLRKVLKKIENYQPLAQPGAPIVSDGLGDQLDVRDDRSEEVSDDQNKIDGLKKNEELLDNQNEPPHQKTTEEKEEVKQKDRRSKRIARKQKELAQGNSKKLKKSKTEHMDDNRPNNIPSEAAVLPEERELAEYVWALPDNKGKIYFDGTSTLEVKDFKATNGRGKLSTAYVEAFSNMLNYKMIFGELKKGHRKKNVIAPRKICIPPCAVWRPTLRKKLDPALNGYIQQNPLFKDLNISLDSVELFFCPVCSNDHWRLLVVDMNKEKIQYLDTIKAKGALEQVTKELDLLREIIYQYFKNKGRTTTVKEFQCELVEVPQQKDTFSCGILVCKLMTMWEGHCKPEWKRLWPTEEVLSCFRQQICSQTLMYDGNKELANILCNLRGKASS